MASRSFWFVLVVVEPVVDDDGGLLEVPGRIRPDAAAETDDDPPAAPAPPAPPRPTFLLEYKEATTSTSGDSPSPLTRAQPSHTGGRGVRNCRPGGAVREASPVKSEEYPATAPSRVIPVTRNMPISRKELMVDVEPEPTAIRAALLLLFVEPAVSF